MLYEQEESKDSAEELQFFGQYHNNFEIANRVFYATVNKFTKQLYSDNKRRSAPYSFRECWHLHNIYSKSQQTLLGIYPVKPSVLLSGDDVLFTHEFLPQSQDDQDWNVDDYTNLAIGGLAVGSEDYRRPYIDHKEYDLMGSTHLFRVSSHHTFDIDSYNTDFGEYYPLQEEEEDPLVSSSSDSSVHPDPPVEPQPETLPRSCSFVSTSSYVSAKSVLSYTSLSDILQDPSLHSSSSLSNYGSVMTHFQGCSAQESASIFHRLFTYILSLWSMILSILFKPNLETTPLLPK